MSLLDSSNETVRVYPEEVTTDADGNTVTRPSEYGVFTSARIWPLTSTESAQDGGFLTVQRFGLRFPRSFPHVLGAQAKVVWNEKLYSVVGDPLVFNGSRRTRHAHYVLERS